MESRPRRHRISVHDYPRMAEVGVLAPDARVELIEGKIIDMAPIGNDHQSAVSQLNRMLSGSGVPEFSEAQISSAASTMPMMVSRPSA